MATMRAKFAGTCSTSTCRKPIAKGDEMTWIKSTRSTYCTACTEQHTRDDDAARQDEAFYQSQYSR